ncbi:MAG: hypothetical protein DRI61_04405 [Chloroflexi bacterium]|nr:MAG: hypothetical protein DRI61_04405 [Chloroflexota bacterium]HDN80911.1 MBL fold metallo-hydrolase [Chloroflexota bacterium]
MLKDRISEGVYAVISDLYFEVTAGFIITPEGVILIDSFPFPSEAREFKKAVLKETSLPIRYLILTHYHADHSLGSYLFEEAEIIAHEKTRTLLRTEGAKRLAEAKRQNPDLEEARIVLPHITFSGEMYLYLGGKHLRLFELPGHSPDSIAIFIEEGGILFAGDLVMPIPYLADGDVDTMIASFESLKELNIEQLVQGHRGVLLRGEIPGVLDENINYLKAIKAKVSKAVEEGLPLEKVLEIDVEDCGKSRIVMGNMTNYIHRANLAALYRALTGSDAR